MGAAVATLAAFTLQFLLEWRWSRRLFLPSLGFDVWSLAKVIAGSACMALVLVGCGLERPSSLGGLAGGVALGAFAYAVSQVVLRTINGTEWRQFCTMIRCGWLNSHFPFREVARYLDGSERNKA
jgi:hypothetical protein